MAEDEKPEKKEKHYRSSKSERPKSRTSVNGGNGLRDGKGIFVKVPIDWDQVSAMCKIQCTQAEICDILGITEKTLTERCKKENDKTFAEFFKEHSQGGKASLRRAQYKAAIENLNPTMLIWLGKQYLEQRDQKDVAHTFEPTKIVKDVPSLENLKDMGLIDADYEILNVLDVEGESE